MREYATSLYSLLRVRYSRTNSRFSLLSYILVLVIIGRSFALDKINLHFLLVAPYTFSHRFVTIYDRIIVGFHRIREDK